MKKRICILTATRAEYGLLRPLIQKLNKIDEFDVRIVATAAHLSPEFGLTYKEIEADGIIIDEKIETLLSSDTPASITKSMGLVLISFADYFKRLKPDLLVVLGDRYETVAVTISAMNQNIPIAHLYGGERTEGATDEAFRHAITKMSYLHFTSTENYRKRVIQLGEDPSRVFHVGSLGVENINNMKLMTLAELEESLKFKLDSPYAIVTFHPVTLDEDNSRKQMEQILEALKCNPDLQYIFTKANSDADGRIINQLIDNYISENSNCIAFTSLGTMRYLSAVKYCKMVIGNSSSGIIEVPSFKKPTINIGDRQSGRIQAKSVINAEAVCDKIDKAIKIAKSNEYIAGLANVTNPYERDHTSQNIANLIAETLKNNRISLKKAFYDIEKFRY